jgi:serine/threonine protein kinase
VLDFGISKTPVTEKERAITNATAIMGSPNYMSPEQLVAAVSVDARSDIWSMGVVLYELLSGKLPFNAASMPELGGVILQGTCVPIGAVVAALPPGLVHVVDTCLQKPRESRYQNIAELARALAPFASSRYEALVEHIEAVLGLGAPPSSTRPPVTASSGDLQISSPAVDNRTLAPTTTSFVKKSQPLKVILPIVAVALVAGGIGLFLARRSTPGPAQQSLVTPATASTTLATSVVPSATSTVNELVPPVVDTAAPQASNVVHVPSSGPHSHASAAASVSAAPSATVAPSASAPACKTVSFFDAAGNKHFKLQCQ